MSSHRSKRVSGGRVGAQKAPPVRPVLDQPPGIMIITINDSVVADIRWPKDLFLQHTSCRIKVPVAATTGFAVRTTEAIRLVACS